MIWVKGAGVWPGRHWRAAAITKFSGATRRVAAVLRDRRRAVDAERACVQQDAVGGQRALCAYEIFGRYLERLTQHTDYVNKLLTQDRFKFDTDERFLLDRRHAPYPQDLAAAEELWSQRLRYEYLQEKLDREFSPTNGGTMLPLPKIRQHGNHRRSGAALQLEPPLFHQLGR